MLIRDARRLIFCIEKPVILNQTELCTVFKHALVGSFLVVV